ncbi:protein phosphatase 1 regulatory subunit 35-like [Cinclus cinclus]|uniref:protein phosphatase 1 regulatory subunit 35-like n=1 Tax=Cinclus cinclus TaxID=127875 RepID=UPI002E15DA47
MAGGPSGLRGRGTSGTRRGFAGAPWRLGGPSERRAVTWLKGALWRRGLDRVRPGNALKYNITSGSYFRVVPPSPPVTAPGRPHHVPPPPAAAAPMSRKKSGFAITSVRGGSGSAPGDASGAATGSSSSSSGSGSPSGSRFRLVRLLSPGEVLRRGRWLCRDFYERDASPRGGGGGGRVPVSLDAPRAVPAPHQPRSLGAFAQLVQQALPPKPPSPRPRGGAELSVRLGLAGEESEDEGTGSGVTAIDNKIERAMVRFAPSPAVPDEEEEDGDSGAPALAIPTLHSSQGGPWGAAPEPFDAPRAAAALLGSSFAARSALGGAAAAAMNVPQAQRLFRGLVSLAVPPPPGPRRGVLAPPTPTPQVPGPQLGVLAGGAGRGVGWPWLPPPTPPEPPQAIPCPPRTTFAMYQKLQQWESC